MLGAWPARRARETLPKGGGLRPPPFKRVSRAPGAGQTPKIDHLRVRGGVSLKSLSEIKDETLVVAKHRPSKSCTP